MSRYKKGDAVRVKAGVREREIQAEYDDACYMANAPLIGGLQGVVVDAKSDDSGSWLLVELDSESIATFHSTPRKAWIRLGKTEASDVGYLLLEETDVEPTDIRDSEEARGKARRRAVAQYEWLDISYRLISLAEEWDEPEELLDFPDRNDLLRYYDEDDLKRIERLAVDFNVIVSEGDENLDNQVQDHSESYGIVRRACEQGLLAYVLPLTREIEDMTQTIDVILLLERKQPFRDDHPSLL